MYTYHVKDPQGNYCKWDASQQAFVSLGEGKSDYTQLTDEEKEAASFSTSVYGQISKIPANYTVEIRNILAGTKFKVEERANEMPDGYSFQKYVYKGEEHTKEDEGVTDTVTTNSNPNVEVCNLKGWGLRVNKTWSDADYMAERDPTYFAVYTRETEGQETLVADTVRQLQYGANPQTLYWYFLPLPVANVPFNQYEIREVTLSGSTPIVDSDGVVTNAGQLTITPIAEKGTLTLGGKQKGEAQTSSFQYKVLYEKGFVPEGSNVRVDTVTNNRPGVELRKAKWDGTTALGGATFTLKRGNEEIGTFASDDTGLISVAFLSDDVDYTLTETKAPQGWCGLQEPLTLRLSSGTLTVTGDVDSSDYYVVDTSGGTPAQTLHPSGHQEGR